MSEVGKISTQGIIMASGTVEARFPYTYEAGDGRTIAFSAGERFTLLNKTNGDWWQVRRGTEKPMYVPASYMTEISIPIYENVVSFGNDRPFNGESVTCQENGQSYESRDKESESNGESTTSDFDYNNINGGTENADENSGDARVVSAESNDLKSKKNEDLKSGSSSVKSLAKSLELVSLICFAWYHHA